MKTRPEPSRGTRAVTSLQNERVKFIAAFFTGATTHRRAASGCCSIKLCAYISTETWRLG
jgi:hypothetical protein